MSWLSSFNNTVFNQSSTYSLALRASRDCTRSLLSRGFQLAIEGAHSARQVGVFAYEKVWSQKKGWATATEGTPRENLLSAGISVVKAIQAYAEAEEKKARETLPSVEVAVVDGARLLIRCSATVLLAYSGASWATLGLGIRLLPQHAVLALEDKVLGGTRLLSTLQTISQPIFALLTASGWTSIFKAAPPLWISLFAKKITDTLVSRTRLAGTYKSNRIGERLFLTIHLAADAVVFLPHYTALTEVKEFRTDTATVSIHTTYSCVKTIFSNEYACDVMERVQIDENSISSTQIIARSLEAGLIPLSLVATTFLPRRLGHTPTFMRWGALLNALTSVDARPWRIPLRNAPISTASKRPGVMPLSTPTTEVEIMEPPTLAPTQDLEKPITVDMQTSTEVEIPANPLHLFSAEAPTLPLTHYPEESTAVDTQTPETPASSSVNTIPASVVALDFSSPENVIVRLESDFQAASTRWTKEEIMTQLQHATHIARMLACVTAQQFTGNKHNLTQLLNNIFDGAGALDNPAYPEKIISILKRIQDVAFYTRRFNELMPQLFQEYRAKELWEQIQPKLREIISMAPGLNTTLLRKEISQPVATAQLALAQIQEWLAFSPSLWTVVNGVRDAGQLGSRFIKAKATLPTMLILQLIINDLNPQVTVHIEFNPADNTLHSPTVYNTHALNTLLEKYPTVTPSSFRLINSMTPDHIRIVGTLMGIPKEANNDYADNNNSRTQFKLVRQVCDENNDNDMFYQERISEKERKQLKQSSIPARRKPKTSSPRQGQGQGQGQGQDVGSQRTTLTTYFCQFSALVTQAPEVFSETLTLEQGNQHCLPLPPPS